jgi:pilus assembly protein FimV
VKAIAGTVLALMAGLASFSAAALGLGQIEVKSRLGEPLLAEIPIVSGDPTELEQLEAVLASPETFARIGMMPPTGVIADMRFVQALDARGNPILRVTTTQPVTEQLLTFLVEVNWGQGRLVREYSALVDTPRTVSAPMQPSVQAPVVEAPALIEQPAVATQEPLPAEPADSAAEPAAEPVGSTAAATPAPADVPAPTPDAIAPSPSVVPPPSVASAPPPPAAAATPGEVRVRNGDTLSDIAREAGLAGTLDQTMIALLRANPEAFIDGNVNLLRAGAVLRVPGEAALAELDPRQASALVNAQAQDWRNARRAVPQPAQAGAAAPTAAAAPNTAPSATPRVAGARLEIVPPGASDATRAGTQSGLSAGGEGAMLQQELVQTKETLAARDAEAQELKTRVAELEKLQQQQQQLIQMKDSELAAAQARLEQSQKQQTQTSLMPWALAAVVAVALGLLIAWLARRRDKMRPSFRAPVAAAAPSIADSFGASVDSPARTVQEPMVEQEEEQAPAPVRKPAEASRTAVPAWHTGTAPKQMQLDPAAQAAYERIELAQAYLDVGDLASARQLLGEVVINGDHAARQQASRMLREME